MFGPFETVALGISGLCMALAALQLGAWGLRSAVRAASDDAVYGE